MPAKDTSHLDGAYLGEREPAVLFSSRALPNVHGIGAVEVLSDPFYDEDAEGFVTSPGGTRFTREYDPTFPTDATAVRSGHDSAPGAGRIVGPGGLPVSLPGPLLVRLAEGS